MERNYEERLEETEKHAGVIRTLLMNNTQAKDMALDSADGHKTEEDATPE
jgi:hypothetical protein